MIFIILLIFIIFVIFLIMYILNKYALTNIETICFGNDFCNGNRNNSQCIHQSCLECGVTSSKCYNDNDCTPNICKDGCCDTL
jgi:hypothetical protein